MTIEIASLALTIAATISLSIALKICYTKITNKTNNTINDLKTEITEINHKFELLEMKINMINEKKNRK